MWADACAAQDWNKLPSAERDDRRREMLAELGFASVKEVDSTTGFDRLKARLLQLADRVSVESADAGQRRRVLYVIGQLLADAYDTGYGHAAETILRDRFKIAPGVRDISDLPTAELTNVARTLKNRLASLNSRRRLVAFLAFAGFIKSRPKDASKPIFDGFKDTFPSLSLQSQIVLSG
jgi:hypothetical protein